jgi:hypothetical protein
LDLLGFIRPIRDFSMGYRQSKIKIFLALLIASRLLTQHAYLSGDMAR